MMLQMRFRDFGPKNQYKRLLRNNDCAHEEKIMRPSTSSSSTGNGRKRCFWVKKVNGGKISRGLKVSRPWKLGFSWLVFPRKIAKIYSQFVKRLIELEGGNNLIFATTWGFPILSHHQHHHPSFNSKFVSHLQHRTIAVPFNHAN